MSNHHVQPFPSQVATNSFPAMQPQETDGAQEDQEMMDADTALPPENATSQPVSHQSIGNPTPYRSSLIQWPSIPSLDQEMSDLINMQLNIKHVSDSGKNADNHTSHDDPQHASKGVPNHSAEPHFQPPTMSTSSNLPPQDLPGIYISPIQQSLVRMASGLDTLTDEGFFHKVLRLYREEVFTPIAKVIGVTADAALRMALSMSRADLEKLSRTTEKPFCGYSAADFVPGNAYVQKPKPYAWDIREHFCLAALALHYYGISRTRDRIGVINAHHLYNRGAKSLVKHLRDMHSTPWLARADYLRLAHEFCERREQAGRAVTRGLGLVEAVWQRIEDMLFDKARLQVYGYTSKHFKNIWQPRHFAKNKQIGQLVTLITQYKSYSSNHDKKKAWKNVEHVIFDTDGLYLGPVLKRYAVGPMPDRLLPSHHYDTEEHAAFRARLLSWVWETVRC